MVCNGRDGDLLALLTESHALNARVFSLLRLQLLQGLAELGPDGATYRELKAAIEVSDGTLFANLNALIAMGYIESEKVMVEKKELESYHITPAGSEEWKQVRDWLCRFCAFGGDAHAES
ncbi:transcriptional regulator [Methanosphaerula subterraneus]|uniref:transcriptional regulator n=1 Tax=Methanosphaerula subterraneus TaxID=3350244 RepID=UPI003F8319F5